MERIDSQYDPHTIEADVDDLWDEIDAREVARATHADDPTFYFLDGPPYASGKTHTGTAWNKIIKDCVVRYLRMCGHDVTDRPGFDMHGLPIETKVEEQVGFESKQDIEEFGVDRFLDRCEEFAERNRERMTEDFKSMGVWMDWEDHYKTNTNEYIEATWWAFHRIYRNGLIEQSDRVINWCSRCQTALADAEVEYDDVVSPSIYVEFPLVDDDASLVIWTTTPWTLPANLYVAVDADMDYSRVRAVKDGDAEELYVATECVEEVLENGRYDDYETLEVVSGDDLVGLEYDHPLAEEIPAQREFDEHDGVHRVYATDFVSAERTGLVHAAPGHGEDDFSFGQERGLPVFAPVDDTGTFTDEAGAYAGEAVTQGTSGVNADIVADLEDHGYLLASGEYSHRYGHCWRCDTPITLRATKQWFIRITQRKDTLLEEVEELEWYPEWGRDSRFMDWVEGARDWCISRQRYWGVPLPVWLPTDGSGKDPIIFESRFDLAERVDQDVDPDDIDLHRPYVDELTVTRDGTTFERVPDIFDVWFESGVASFASLGFPENEDAFERLWPADFITEAHDMTRGWFWSQLAVGVAALGESPYTSVLMHGFLNDAKGDKMSKSVGNIVEPKTVRERMGVDPFRLYLFSHDQRGVDFEFSWDGIEAMQSRLNVVWNAYRFALEYMSLDDFDPASVDLEEAALETVDRWVLSRLQSVERRVTEHNERFRLHKSTELLLDFLESDVSRFYIQQIRERVWEEDDSSSKHAAYSTLYTVLVESAKLLAPFAPYVTEAVYQKLDGRAATIHALEWPRADEAYADETLETEMEAVRRVANAASTARQYAGHNLRWPISRLVVSTDDDLVAEAVSNLEPFLLDRTNARQLELVRDEWTELTWDVHPKMDVLGPTYGGVAQEVGEAARDLTRADLPATVQVDGETYEITGDMVEFERALPEGVFGAEFDDGWVYVDTNLSEELRAEGYVRDVVRRIQQMRKDLDLEIDRQIDLAIEADDAELTGYVEGNSQFIADETRATFVESLDDDGLSSASLERREWELRGKPVTIAIAPRGDRQSSAR